MNKETFIAALKMNGFEIANQHKNLKIVLIQKMEETKINGLYISIGKDHNDKDIVQISRIFSPTKDIYYDLNRAYKIILDKM